MKTLRKSPNLSFERRYWEKGYNFIAGLDEVGRGSFAGPVVTGCVVFDSKIKVPDGLRIDDSKKLTARQRNEAGGWIKENSLYHSVGEASVSTINKKGIGKATHVAFRRAVKKVNEYAEERIEYLLIDAYNVPYIRGFPTSGKVRQKAIQKGDSRSLSIAAASIIAKEYRDRLMSKLSDKSPFDRYLWHKNKGYGTKEHRDAIRNHGITKHHRIDFCKSYLDGE